jgi:hypothetical protein
MSDPSHDAAALRAPGVVSIFTNRINIREGV